MASQDSTAVDILAGARTVGAVEVAGAALFFYDYALSLGDEIELIWRQRWGAGKILFLLARYLVVPQLFITIYTALFNPAHMDCRAADTYAIWSLGIGIIAANGILVLRTWAIWGTRRSILAILAAVLCANTALSCYLAVVFVRGLDPDPLHEYPLLGYHLCTATAMNDSIGIFWIAVAAFDLFIFIMTIIKGLRFLRERPTGVVRTLFRDSILYFFYIFSISAANVVLIYGGGSRADPPYVLLLGLLQSSLHSVLSCRMVLHIRAQASLSQIASISVPTDPAGAGAERADSETNSS